MRITVIEMSHDEAMGLFLTMKNEEPEITEIHEDFEEAIPAQPRPAMKQKVYVASSWRNEHQESLVEKLRLMGYEVYDFKHPKDGEGFQWSRIDENWQGWSMRAYREALNSDYARFGFNRDFDAMKAADICVLCLPCGRSAHLEAGWMKGAGKKVVAFIPPGHKIEPELMYGMLDGVALCIQDLVNLLKGGQQ